MKNPFTHRPEMEHHDVDFDDWADNPISNLLAWSSDVTGLSKVAENPNSAMTRLTLYMWSDCATCLFWRGVTTGAVTTATIGVLIAVTFY